MAALHSSASRAAHYTSAAVSNGAAPSSASAVHAWRPHALSHSVRVRVGGRSAAGELGESRSLYNAWLATPLRSEGHAAHPGWTPRVAPSSLANDLHPPAYNAVHFATSFPSSSSAPVAPLLHFIYRQSGRWRGNGSSSYHSQGGGHSGGGGQRTFAAFGAGPIALAVLLATASGGSEEAHTAGAASWTTSAGGGDGGGFWGLGGGSTRTGSGGGGAGASGSSSGNSSSRSSGGGVGAAGPPPIWGVIGDSAYAGRRRQGSEGADGPFNGGTGGGSGLDEFWTHELGVQVRFGQQHPVRRSIHLPTPRRVLRFPYPNSASARISPCRPLQLSLGTVAGFCSGYAVKKVSKVVAVTIGVVFMGVQVSQAQRPACGFMSLCASDVLQVGGWYP